MKQAVVCIGIGEIGGVFARGLLRSSHPVYPINRGMSMADEAAAIPAPLFVLVAVAEDTLSAVLETVPDQWRDRLGLLQNELLPRDWTGHVTTGPTVISVWFEKKRGQDVKVLLPSPVFGPHAALVESALAAVAIPSRRLRNPDELLYELVRKNVYILTTNIAGLVTGGNVETLWAEHRTLAEAVAKEVIAIQSVLVGREQDSEALIAGMVEAFAADPAHKCMGRTAEARLRRALSQADGAGLAVPRLREIDNTARCG